MPLRSCTNRTLPDIAPTPSLFGSLINHTKIFVLIQNGIGIERDLQAVVPLATILSGCAWIDCTIVDNYRTLRHGGLDSLVVGAHEPPSNVQIANTKREEMKVASRNALETFLELLQAGGAKPIMATNIVAERWRKNLW
jgi:2-dehydropantoate 2-reductase